MSAGGIPSDAGLERARYIVCVGSYSKEGECAFPISALPSTRFFQTKECGLGDATVKLSGSCSLRSQARNQPWSYGAEMKELENAGMLKLSWKKLALD